MLHALARGGAAAGPEPAQRAVTAGGVRYRQPVQQRLDDRQVSRDPGQAQHLVTVPEVDPAQLIVVLQGPGNAVEKFGEPHAHRSALVERPAVGGAAVQFGAEPDAHAQLFQQLAVQGLLGRLAGLDLAAGELPHAGELRGRRPPRHEQPAGFGQGIQYCAADDADESSHAPKSRGGGSLGETMGGGRLPKTRNTARPPVTPTRTKIRFILPHSPGSSRERHRKADE